MQFVIMHNVSLLYLSTSMSCDPSLHCLKSHQKLFSFINMLKCNMYNTIQIKHEKSLHRTLPGPILLAGAETHSVVHSHGALFIFSAPAPQTSCVHHWSYTEASTEVICKFTKS